MWASKSHLLLLRLSLFSKTIFLSLLFKGKQMCFCFCFFQTVLQMFPFLVLQCWWQFKWILILGAKSCSQFACLLIFYILIFYVKWSEIAIRNGFVLESSVTDQRCRILSENLEKWCGAWRYFAAFSSFYQQYRQKITVENKVDSVISRMETSEIVNASH